MLLMQPVAQTTRHVILPVSAGALEVLLQYTWRFRSGHTLVREDCHVACKAICLKTLVVVVVDIP